MEIKCEELSVAVKFLYLRTSMSMRPLGALYQTTDCIAETLMHLNDEMVVVVISEPRGIK